MKETYYSNKFFSFYYRKEFGWFRLFNKGLSWKNVNIMGLKFSERNGFSKYLKIGKWIISYLPK
jgi:hypothetical protein